MTKSSFFHCEKCNYNTSRHSDYNKHILTARHINTNDKIPISEYKYVCEKCNYYTSSIKDYNKHLMTAKHKSLQRKSQLGEKILNSEIKLYKCECGKTYKHSSSLYGHKKTCKLINNIIDNSENDNILEKQAENPVIEPDSDYKSMFIELIKQNADFKSLIIEQSKQLNEKDKETKDMQNSIMVIQKQLIDVVKDGKTINNMTNSNNNNNFNLNFFLNNTCKDAMNMSEFIENINVEFKDIEYIGRNGYVNGMTNMILSRIKDLDVTKRPLHCTDLKRETMYIKDNDEWNKDTPDNTQLRNMVKIVAKHNQYQFPLWREKHPASDDMNSSTFEFSLKMIQNILGDVGEEHIKLDNKVMRNLSKHILVDKNI